jgi:hypothetical protein
MNPLTARLRHELPDRELFHSLKEAPVLIEQWRRHDNTLRPHSAPGYRPPAPEATLPRLIGPAYAALRHATPRAETWAKSLIIYGAAFGVGPLRRVAHQRFLERSLRSRLMTILRETL